MPHLHKFTLAGAAFLLCVTAIAAGQEKTAEHYTASLYIENDVGWTHALGGSDRWYTNGFMIGFTHQPDWADDLAAWLPLQEELGQPKERTGVGYLLGQLMFTPQNIRRTTPNPNDRPYAGYDFIGAYWQRANDHTLDGIQLDLGFVGQSTAADNIQSTVHDIFGGDDPNGWDHQIPDEPTAQLHLRKKWKIRAWADDDSALALEGLPYGTLSLGTVNRSLELGGVMRLGWHLPDDFGPPRIADPLDAVMTAPTSRWSLYGFAGGGVHVVEHNLFIEGSEFQDSPGVEIEPIYTELRIGFAGRYQFTDCAHLQIAWSNVWQSEQFENQSEPHSYGALVFSGHLVW